MEEDNVTFFDKNATVALGPGFTAFVIIRSLTLVAVIVFVGLIVKALHLSTSVALPVRVLLTNLLIANATMAVTLLCQSLMSVVLSLSDSEQPPLLFCRFVLWVYFVALDAKLHGLLGFSAMVLQTIVCTTRRIGVKWLICSLVLIWMAALLTTVGYIVPPLSRVHFFGGVACCPNWQHFVYHVIHMTYLLLWPLVACLVPPLVFICIPLATLCYTTQHTNSEGAQYKKAMAKFAAYLIIGSALDVLCQLVPTFVREGLSNVVRLYLAFSLTVLALFPTPILIVVFLKPVQKHLCHLLFRKCQKNSEIVPMQQDNTQ